MPAYTMEEGRKEEHVCCYYSFLVACLPIPTHVSHLPMPVCYLLPRHAFFYHFLYHQGLGRSMPGGRRRRRRRRAGGRLFSEEEEEGGVVFVHTLCLPTTLPFLASASLDCAFPAFPWDRDRTPPPPPRRPTMPSQPCHHPSCHHCHHYASPTFLPYVLCTCAFVPTMPAHHTLHHGLLLLCNYHL